MARVRRFAVRLLFTALLVYVLSGVVLWATGGSLIFRAGNRLWWIGGSREAFQVITVGGWTYPERPRWQRTSGFEGTPVLRSPQINSEYTWHNAGLYLGMVVTPLQPDGTPATRFQVFSASSMSAYPNSAPKAFASLWMPYWAGLLPAGLVLGVAPARWFRAARKRLRRRQAGLCLVCGYDLRASTERCPECGEITATSSAPPRRSTGG